MTSTLVSSDIAGSGEVPQRLRIVARLHKATGQLAGATRMVEDQRSCTEVLDQLSAVRAAVDAVALLVTHEPRRRVSAECG